jgi:hypothetical protein
MSQESNPVYYVRYEDLIQDRYQTLKELFAFLLDCENVNGTNIERRIQQLPQ